MIWRVKMARTIYVGREGESLSSKQWKIKQDDPSYAIVRQYDNGVVQATLKWSGVVNNPSNTFEEYWPVYILIVKNYRADGTLVNDPVDDGKLFPNEEKALEAYQEFLFRWTNCALDEEGGFVEVDNTLEPAKAPEPELPPDPNRPATVSDELDDLGAW